MFCILCERIKCHKIKNSVLTLVFIYRGLVLKNFLLKKLWQFERTWNLDQFFKKFFFTWLNSACVHYYCYVYYRSDHNKMSWILNIWSMHYPPHLNFRWWRALYIIHQNSCKSMEIEFWTLIIANAAWQCLHKMGMKIFPRVMQIKKCVYVQKKSLKGNTTLRFKLIILQHH